MKVVDPVHRSTSISHDPFDDVINFALSVDASDVAHGARATREQLRCSQLYVMVLGTPSVRLAFLSKLIDAVSLPMELASIESIPVLIRYGRSPHARIHAGARILDVAVEAVAGFFPHIDALEIAVPSSVLEPGVCIINPFQRSAAVRGFIPRTDLAVIVTEDVPSAARELQQARSFGFEHGNIVLMAAASQSGAFATSPHIVFSDTSLGWNRMLAFLRRRTEQSGAGASQGERDCELRRVVARIRCVLNERQLALESSSQMRLHVGRRSAAVARAVQEARRVRVSLSGTADLVEYLETERIKFLMTVKADLLGELVDLIAAMDAPPTLVLPCSIALAQELSASAVFQWCEHIASAMHGRLVAIFEHHIQWMWRELDVAPEFALAATSVLVEPRSFIRQPRVGRTTPSPDRGQVGDWLRGRSGLQRRAVSVATELLLTSLETSSRSVVELCLASIGESQHAFEGDFANTLQWIADTCAEATSYAEERRTAGAHSVEDAMSQNRVQRGELEELAQLLPT